MVPKAKGVTMFETTEATLGSEEVNVHHPDEVEAGGLSVRLPTLSFMMEMSPKVPSTGAMVTTVNFIEVEADSQLGVLLWVA